MLEPFQSSKKTTQEGLSLKKSNLKLLMPKAYLQLSAGSFVEVHSLQSRPEWNGRIASVVQLLGERWAIQIEGQDEPVSLKPENLRLTTFHHPLPSLELQQSIDLETLASMVLQDFVEGPRSYPVIRKLSKFKKDNGSEELHPAKASEKRLLPTTWCDLELSQSERLFYKMSLSGRCSELTYTFVDLINGMAETQLPTFRGKGLAGMFLCVGFVTHPYRRMHLMSDFGEVYWQHSRQVHNGARNHLWMEFPVPGASPHDQRKRMILDLAGAQFDMHTPGKRFVLVKGQDKRYQKCYEIPCTVAPLHFLLWSAKLNNVNFDAKHLVESIYRLRHQMNISSNYSSCTQGHVLLTQILNETGMLGPGALATQLFEEPRIRPLEQACGMRLSHLNEMETTAAGTMRAALGQGPQPELGGTACEQQ